MRALATLGGLGFVMAALVGLGALLGVYLDRRWGTSPWLALVGTLLGLAGALFEVITTALRAEREDKDDTGASRK